VLGEAEYVARLDEKLAEELAEYREGWVVEELADIVEVIEAIAAARGLTWTEFEALREAKGRERGGFPARLLLVSSEEQPQT